MDGNWKIFRAAGLSVLLAGVLGSGWAAAAETRCGWIQNPTPGNWWFTDADESWTIRTQGTPWEPLGMDRIGDISAGEYRKSNGNYGYGCACAEVDTSIYEGEPYITAIHSFTQIPLSRCDSDPALAQ